MPAHPGGTAERKSAMTTHHAEKVAADRWSGPEWFRHIAGRPLADRRARRAPLSWKDELALLFPPG